jgi:hypothetical protein
MKVRQRARALGAAIWSSERRRNPNAILRRVPTGRRTLSKAFAPRAAAFGAKPVTNRVDGCIFQSLLFETAAIILNSSAANLRLSRYNGGIFSKANEMPSASVFPLPA